MGVEGANDIFIRINNMNWARAESSSYYHMKSHIRFGREATAREAITVKSHIKITGYNLYRLMNTPSAS